MPNRPGNDDRNSTVGGNAGQRDLSNESGRPNAGQSAGQSASVPPSVAGQVRTRSNRGFASMDREKQKEIASKGGKAAHAKGTAHEFDSSEAREAGRKGGVAVSRNREHMAAIGRRGGEARGHSRARGNAPTNTGSAESSSGSYQNTQRPVGASSDRQVAIDNGSEGVSSNTQGSRGGNSSLGGERRPSGIDTAANNPNRSDTFGNH